MHTVFRILIRCFLRTQEFFKDIAKQLVNGFETGPIKEKSTNSKFFPHFREFHIILWNSNFSPSFWNFICSWKQTGKLINRPTTTYLLFLVGSSGCENLSTHPIHINFMDFIKYIHMKFFLRFMTHFASSLLE